MHSIRIRRLIQSCRRCVYGGDQRGKTLYWTTRARDIILLVMMLLLIVLVIVMYDNIILGTETCEMDNVFPPDDLWFGLDTYDSLYEYMYIYISVFGSLISDVTCNYVFADGGRDGLWWPALPGHWLSYSGCWLSLLVMYWLLCLGCCFYFQPPP